MEVAARRLAVGASAPARLALGGAFLVRGPFDIVPFGLESVWLGLEPVSLERLRGELPVGEDELVVKSLHALVGGLLVGRDLDLPLRAIHAFSKQAELVPARTRASQKERETLMNALYQHARGLTSIRSPQRSSSAPSS